MTREQKIAWLENATNEELVKQICWVTLRTKCDSISVVIEAQEDLTLVKAEMLKRMSK